MSCPLCGLCNGYECRGEETPLALRAYTAEVYQKAHERMLRREAGLCDTCGELIAPYTRDEEIQRGECWPCLWQQSVLDGMVCAECGAEGVCPH